MSFKREVSCVVEPDDCIRNIAFESFSAGWKEKRIVPTPHGEEGWPGAPEIALKLRVERNVAFVVAEEVKLDLVRSGTGEIMIVERVSVRRDQRNIGHAMSILPDRGLGREKGS
jgi:hypothetical protein